MGIQIEFNPDLALRNFREYLAKRRRWDECIPKVIEKGKIYAFHKEGQRNYYLEGELPLLETKGNQKLSRPVASIKIIHATHQMGNGKVITTGTYKVIEVFDPKSPKIHFESYARVK